MLINVADWEQTIFPRTPSLRLMFSPLQFPACFSALKHACGIKRFPSRQMLGEAQRRHCRGQFLYRICEFKAIFMGWVKEEGQEGLRKKRGKASEEGGMKRERQKMGNERKTGKIADFNFLPLLRGNKLWLSNQLQPLCHKSSHMRGTMTHSSLRSLSFLHAFLFWGECSWMI